MTDFEIRLPRDDAAQRHVQKPLTTPSRRLLAESALATEICHNTMLQNNALIMACPEATKPQPNEVGMAQNGFCAVR